MTKKEQEELESLCRNFSALSEEHKRFALDVSKSLLSLQGPAMSDQDKEANKQARWKMEDAPVSVTG